MVRQARIVIPGAWHHITQRGNNQQDVFFVDDDREVYLDLLHQQAQKYGFSIEGYCLMTNHIHVVGVPVLEESLAKAMGRTHFLYTQYVNKLHKRSGHLWQNRFYSCPMDEAHGYNALAYVELNPVRARMVSTPEDYPWSSAAAHLGKGEAHACLNMASWQEDMTVGEWGATLRAIARDKGMQEMVRVRTHTGRPLGSDSFMSKVEYLLGRRVRPLPVGRQKGWRKQVGKEI